MTSHSHPGARQAQSAGLGSGTSARASSARQSVTPSRTGQSHQEALLGKDALVSFATEAVVVLREQCVFLLRQARSNNFVLELKTLLTNVETRLERTESLTESRVTNLLFDMERLARWPKGFPVPARPLCRKSFPHLVDLLRGNLEQARISIKRLAGDQNSLKARDEQRKFKKTFRNFANVKDEQRGPNICELVKPSEETRAATDELTECLRRLYTTLHQFCRSASTVDSGRYQANVGLTLLSQSKGEDGLTAHLFLIHEHKGEMNRTIEWKEAHVRVYLESPNDNSRIEKSKSARIAQAGQEVSDLCSLICSEVLGRLKLAASSNGLFHEGVDPSYNEHRISLRAPSVPLARILSSADLKQDLWRRLLLSYLLAKAVWQFFDSDWMDNSWTKNTVHFMRQRLDNLKGSSIVDHRPFISADFKPSAASVEQTTDPRTRTHIYPKVLTLGLILLEIELGEGIESRYPAEYFHGSGQERPNASHMVAGQFITSKEWKDQRKTLKPVRQAIEICLKPDTAVLGTDPTRVRENLYKYIVAPFAELFERMWGQLPEETDHCSIAFDGHGTFLGQKCGAPMREPTPPETRRRTPDPMPSELVRNAALLASSSKIHDSHSWLSKFDVANLHLYKLTSTSQPGPVTVVTRKTLMHSNHPRAVKVAILDTGCDRDHPFFSGPGAEQSDDLLDRWLDCLEESDEPVDDDIDRHGTAIAALMLRLLPGAEIYVVRIAKDLGGLSAAEATIANAITQVAAKWNVDIMSISFGFTDDLKLIYNAIIDAEKDHSIIFFAAANNDGRNEPEMFPASMESVISVRGTRHDGSFDPQYDPKSSKDGPQYGSLARDVPCGWTSDSLTKSGCSIATPIVAAIAALVISFVEREETLKAYRNVVRTRRGMLSVFKTMADDPKSSRLDLAPWQLYERKRVPKLLIGHALSNA